MTDNSISRNAEDGQRSRAGLIAAGGVLGAIAASSCCVLPLLFFSVGVSGAWLGQLAALEPYKPVFIVATLGLLGYGYLLVHRSSKRTCEEGSACAKPLPNRLVKVGLWTATLLISLSIVWPYIVPLIFV